MFAFLFIFQLDWYPRIRERSRANKIKIYQSSFEHDSRDSIQLPTRRWIANNAKQSASLAATLHCTVAYYDVSPPRILRITPDHKFTSINEMYLYCWRGWCRFLNLVRNNLPVAVYDCPTAAVGLQSLMRLSERNNKRLQHQLYRPYSLQWHD